ncbi:membrane dipeptidase-domain-containing protein [Mycena alexandri]|uniref:Dipeptidase n=1 Tax=Mycena alexandri TaxID=1745969 RepID=A0AAD6T3P9_9AGAR|nr:membrane dipeptidase-domain-containing protein [Mycena alexandri]
MSPSPSPERPPPPRDQPSREQVNQAAILGLSRNYVSTQRIDDRPADENTRLWQPSAEAIAADNIIYAHEHPTKARGIIWGLLTILVAGALVILLGAPQLLPDALGPLVGRLPKDPLRAALRILDAAPVIVYLPILLRSRFGNNVSAIDLSEEFVGHVDIPRLRQGKVGGFFWSVYRGKDFLGASWRVRDTLEQIDVARLTIDKYPDARCSRPDAITNGKIASLLGVEGGHQLGNSLAVLRQYHALGVRYVTLTHTCHNAFADSCGFEPGMIPLHGGLSALGLRLIDEMNRLGVLVDLSHTSDDTARQALKHSKAPVIWSHSSARAVHDVPRNVPDDVLALVGTGEGQTDAVVMVNFAPFFVADPGNATVYTVADHVEHIAKIAGKLHVGLGSDYDGIDSTPVGLEDIAELYTRGWNKYELAGLTGANLLRVFEGAEKAARDLKAAGTLPAFDVYPMRTDLPIL